MFLLQHAWLIWVTVAVGLIVLDVTLAGAQFILTAAAAAALVSALLAAFGALPSIQAWTFLAATALFVPAAILALRGRQRASRPQVRDSGWANGRETKVEKQGQRTLVRLEGDTFPARSEDETPLAEGTRVRVDRLDGITAIVRPLTPPEAASSPRPETSQCP